jgi:hypothetical protein
MEHLYSRTAKRTVHLVEHHELALFEIEEMISVLEDAGLNVTYDAQGLTGRGLYIGRNKGESVG